VDQFRNAEVDHFHAVRNISRLLEKVPGHVSTSQREQNDAAIAYNERLVRYIRSELQETH
jgi:hypothetical protein